MQITDQVAEGGMVKWLHNRRLKSSLFQTDPGSFPGAAGSLVCVCHEGQQRLVLELRRLGGLATSVILPRETRILEEGAAAHT